LSRGVLVVGAAHGAEEAAAADAVADVLGRAGTPAERIAAIALGPGAGGAAIHAHRALASPVTAARHEGAAIDPAALVAALRAAGEPLVVSAAGGLLAPITPRYSVRDLAGELALPLVLAVRAGGDATNLARLTLESARGSGLAVTAIVLTGWPDPPDRVLLDERALLADVVDVPVLNLKRDSPSLSSRDWPVLEWLEAPAAAPAAAEVVLDPYEAWEPRPMGDPRATPRPRIMEALLEIVATEGPMRASRAYALYNRAAGGKKLTSIARAPLSSAVYWLAQDGKVVLTRREDIPWQDDDLVRTPDTPAVHVRALGGRTLEEVPLDEIAELMRRLRAAHPTDDALKRAVLSTYGLVRLTARADEYLGLALGLVER
jgi:AAA domain